MKTEVAPRPARVFRNGNSVAVRLPLGWAKPGMIMQARRNGKVISLESREQRPKTLGALMEMLRAVGPDPGPFVRQPFSFPEREFMKD